MKYLLDTHAWLWFVRGQNLPVRVQNVFDEARRNDELCLSPISLWEIAMKASRGRLQIPAPIREWLKLSVRASGVWMADFDMQVAVECAELPPAFHGDPVDRILASTCRVQGLTLLTRDSALLKSAARGVFRAERI